MVRIARCPQCKNYKYLTDDGSCRSCSEAENRGEVQDNFTIPSHARSWFDTSSPDSSDTVTQYWIDKPHSYVEVLEDDTDNYKYVIREPKLSASEEEMLESCKRKMDISVTFSDKDVNSYDEKREYIEGRLEMLVGTGYLSDELSDEELSKISYYIKRDLAGFEKVDALVEDTQVKHISCDRPDENVVALHKEYGEVMTNVEYGRDELRSFIQELADKCGESMSETNRKIESSIDEIESRVNATYGREDSFHTHAYTIDKDKQVPLTPAELIESGATSATQMAYFWLIAENNKSILFAGPPTSGKTTLMNAVSLFLPRNLKVTTVEDTRELHLPHKNWNKYSTAQPSSNRDISDSDYKRLLLLDTLRMRPEHTIAGEIRGEESVPVLQAMSTGHTVYTTMTSDNVSSVVEHLNNPPVNIPKQMIESLDVVCVQDKVQFTGKEDSKTVRRVESINEMDSLDDNNQFNTKSPFEWDEESDQFVNSLETSDVLSEIAHENEWSDEELQQQLDTRRQILEYMTENGHSDYETFEEFMKAFYTDKDRLVYHIRKQLQS